MIIYNVTTKVERSIAQDWLRWMQQTHIPEMLQTGCFQHARIVKLLEVDEEEGPTYAVQYEAPSRSDYDRYLQEHAATLRQHSFDAWGNRFIAFRSIMEVVQ